MHSLNLSVFLIGDGLVYTNGRSNQSRLLCTRASHKAESGSAGIECQVFADQAACRICDAMVPGAGLELVSVQNEPSWLPCSEGLTAVGPADLGSWVSERRPNIHVPNSLYPGGVWIQINAVINAYR